MTDRAPDILEILDSYDRSQEALNFTPRSDNDIRAQMIAKAVREWNGDLVAVKELEWELGSGTNTLMAGTPFGPYRIETGALHFRLYWHDYMPKGVFDTLDAAKSAAQTDHEIRIRSALKDTK